MFVLPSEILSVVGVPSFVISSLSQLLSALPVARDSIILFAPGVLVPLAGSCVTFELAVKEGIPLAWPLLAINVSIVAWLLAPVPVTSL